MEDRSRSLDDLRSLAPSLSFGLPLPPRARSLSRGETTNLNLIRSRLFSARVRSAIHERALNLPNGRKRRVPTISSLFHPRGSSPAVFLCSLRHSLVVARGRRRSGPEGIPLAFFSSPLVFLLLLPLLFLLDVPISACNEYLSVELVRWAAPPRLLLPGKNQTTRGSSTSSSSDGITLQTVVWNPARGPSHTHT